MQYMYTEEGSPNHALNQVHTHTHTRPHTRTQYNPIKRCCKSKEPTEICIKYALLIYNLSCAVQYTARCVSVVGYTAGKCTRCVCVCIVIWDTGLNRIYPRIKAVIKMLESLLKIIKNESRAKECWCGVFISSMAMAC